VKCDRIIIFPLTANFFAVKMIASRVSQLVCTLHSHLRDGVDYNPASNILF